MAVEQDYGEGKLKLPLSGVIRTIAPYLRMLFTEQLRSIWFIVFYLGVFQIVVLGLPIVHALMIAVGVMVVLFGLMFFMEGLRLGLMPFGETIGATMPRRAPLAVMLIFAFLLGIGATLAEPAIFVLKTAGATVRPNDAPLLYSLLNDFSNQLVLCVGIGVGLAVMLGLMRFLYGWSLKILIVPTVLVLCGLTAYAHFTDALEPVLGLAWDCGAVTTGPVTVPLVLALGIGVTRVVMPNEGGGQGFGIVTLASLFPILAVLLLGIYHYKAKDYYGQPNYVQAAEPVSTETQTTEAPSLKTSEPEFRLDAFTEEEFEELQETGKFPARYTIEYEGGEYFLENGKIKQRDAVLVYHKVPASIVVTDNLKMWDSAFNITTELINAFKASAQAILPLMLFLFIVYVVVIRQKLSQADEIVLGIAFALLGMTLFVLGIALGLTPLGSQLGSNIPAAFDRITPWGLDGFKGPIYQGLTGIAVAIIFGFFLGYGATLAEPALNALGATVEKITIGAFPKSLLMQAVAIGVGSGIGLGVAMIAFNLSLALLLVPLYLILITLSLISSEEFVNFSWDSAGVTTGPITVPLVLAMGLGLRGSIPNVIDGFGVLALASVGPIISVLVVGLLVRKTSGQSSNLEDEEEADAAA